MAMPSGNVVISDEVQGGGCVAGAEMLQYPEYNRQSVPLDERDGFINWIRGEFAAANAIIDSMCDHLKVNGIPGEYDTVIGTIQHRRLNWYPVLHMQQYCSVDEVIRSLHQIALSRRHGRRFGGGYRQGYQRGIEGKNDGSRKPQLDSSSKRSASSQANTSGSAEGGAVGVDTKGSCYVPLENGSPTSQISHGKQKLSTKAKTFVGTEIVDGKAVNAVDGMKLFKGFLDGSEVASLVTLVDDLRRAGRNGQFQGQTFVISKRPIWGHGREMIQLGVPIADAPPRDDSAAGTSKDRMIEPIPGLLQDVIERLIASQVITVEPDSCIIDFYKEGDYSQPHMWPQWFGRPVCLLFLTECDMAFGKVITMDYPGNYNGSINLSFTPGSMLVMEGRSTDFSRHAIPALRKQRILVTFTKSQPKNPNNGHYYASAIAAPPTLRVPPPSRSPNHICHPTGPKHYVRGPTTGVFPAPHTHVPPLNASTQPVFVPTAVAPGRPFPPPRLLVPGTGVFLPPGSGNVLIQPSLTESLYTEEVQALSENDNGTTKSNGNSTASPNGNVNGKNLRQDCNRTNGEVQLNEDLKVVNEPAATV